MLRRDDIKIYSMKILPEFYKLYKNLLFNMILKFDLARSNRFIYIYIYIYIYILYVGNLSLYKLVFYIDI